MADDKIITGITMGDPAGVGPDIILQAVANNRLQSQHLVIGDTSVLEAVKKELNYGVEINSVQDVNEVVATAGVVNVLDLDNIKIAELDPGVVQQEAGRAAVEYVKKGIRLALANQIDAVVTAPINKAAIHKAGFKYPGHTEIFAEMTETDDFAMMLYSEKLNVIHATTHMALGEACQTISQERVETVIELADETLQRMGIANPQIAVAGLNPHAGESGIFGQAEIEEITPAIKTSHKQGINAAGPIPPDTVFVRAVEGEYDIVVVMYHDQGHIPVKLLGFDSGVNITAGLPIIRTSVDHGTAFDIAWQGKAYDTSLVEAVKVAIKLADK
ncbi:4-hydroxythreonine-4-phosphate dehydrogenase [Halobacteroides halobius DSM 5150]|uniref:4-hydroxythreonine-4-phosphate dehydrogenase n=1 Tax=Halobacteroides halobius (strain ATCC 35273 / DSM 5150 / MD-1) TaxID=748449 RepID=L0K775_HALHC|nr:4-hydroxythreonine-4-phosphate dehydrogenase PdxA [Halobacteroides halobius]AGB41137.1 4-hydroxythreonine-4-phosphate dehydrogenase [Halobacteroides halobius DSM 5150]